MRILVTGSRGKVGSATVDALHAAGHEVTACDLGAPVFESPPPGAPALPAGRPHRRRRRVRRGARPRRSDPRRRDPRADPQPAAHGVPEQPDVASSTRSRPRSASACRASSTSRARPSRASSSPSARGSPDYAPVDEEHPIRPQDPYATAKYFGELLMDAAMRRSDIRCLSIRPSWVQWEGNYDAQPRPDPARSRGLGAERGAVGLHRRLRPRRLACGSPPSPTSTPTRSSTSPRPTTPPTARWPTSSATITATPSRSASRSPAPTPRDSRSRRRNGCSATRRRAPGATTCPRTGRCSTPRASGSSAATPASSAGARSA